MSPTSPAESGAPTALVRLQPRLLSDLVARQLRCQGVRTVVSSTRAPDLGPGAPRRFDVVITSAGLPHGVRADVVIASVGTLTTAGEPVDVWHGSRSHRVRIEDLGDLLVLTLMCLRGHFEPPGVTRP